MSLALTLASTSIRSSSGVVGASRMRRHASHKVFGGGAFEGNTGPFADGAVELGARAQAFDGVEDERVGFGTGEGFETAIPRD